MPSLGSIGRDLRALGTSAPLRAAYEASKRSGFHSVLFRDVGDRGIRSVSVGLGRHVPSSGVARRRCLEDAALILSDGVRVFGHRVPTGVHASWNLDPLSGQPWPSQPKWWQIDIRTQDRMSDVKWVWEAARHRDVVILARADSLDPSGPWLTELQVMLSGWLTQCRPERGVNWYSSLELALRAVSWAQTLELVGDRLGSELRAGLDAQLVASARHIMLELPYTVSSMKNNHLLGDGLGLVLLGKMFPDHPGAARWQRIGDALFHKQLARHMHDDGSMIEDSLSYHRFVLEMLIVRVLLGGASAEVTRAMAGAAEHLRRLGVAQGEVPQYGDWDEGRVLADSRPAGSVAGSMWAGLALSGFEVPLAAFGDHDELAWYVAARQQRGDALAQLGNARRVGDFHVLSSADVHVWVKTGSSPSHQHADVGSVWIRKGNSWITRDPGTGTYNGPIAVRNGFRTSAAHPVWRPDGADQMVAHRAFRWLRSVTATHAEAFDEGRQVVLSLHDAFVHEVDQSRVARVVDLHGAEVRVVDFIERPDRRPWVMTVPTGDHNQFSRLFGVDGKHMRGLDSPFRGWISSTYGEWHPADWFEVALLGNTHVWGLGVSVHEAGDRAARIADSCYTAMWTDAGVEVTVTSPESVPLTLRAGHG